MDYNPHPFSDPSVTDNLSYESSDYRSLNGNSSNMINESRNDGPPIAKEKLKDEVRNKEEILAAKEVELAERERVLTLQQQELEQYGHPPNWPPCRPFIYHSIDDEIPSQFQKTVRFLYFDWFISLGTLVFNLISTFFILISGAQTVTTGAADFGMALVYLFIIPPLAFFLWYRPAYLAHRTISSSIFSGRSILFYAFFAFFFFHILFLFYMGIGIPGKGGGGLINLLSMIGTHQWFAVVLLVISTILWFGTGLLSVVLFKLIHSHYRLNGCSFELAKQEIQLGLFAKLFSRSF